MANFQADNVAATPRDTDDRRAMRSLIARCRLSCSFAIAWHLVIVPATADTHTWTDAAVGNSDWNDGDNWSPVGPPASLDSVIIPTPVGGAGPAVVNINSAVADATVGANGTTPQIQILAGRDLTFNAGDLINDGLIVVNSDAGTTAARFAGDGSVTIAHEASELDTKPLAAGTYKLDGDKLTLTYASGEMCPKGVEGTYTVVISRVGIRFTKVDDACERRARMDGETWYRK